ncbi:MAG: 5'/3'-nucleotidase SurE [Flavobacteriales bacterium AspAUS03]
MKTKPIILVTNDDGIIAPGIRALIRMMNTIGNVYVVAPDKPQSGMGHAITVEIPLHGESVEIDQGPQQEWQCSGTPVDCIKLAIGQILPKRPDICVSGINHGSNASVNVIYSGTMSAAVEAAIEGIPAIGFSLLDFSWEADFKPAQKYVCQIVQKILEKGLPKDVSLNVNIPKIKEKEIKGIKICRQAKARWKENFDKRLDPKGRTYYWLTGEFVNLDQKEDTDEWALANRYISVVPIQFDLTAHASIQTLKSLEL